MKTYDIAIVGGGVVGLTFALALAKHTSLSILILESQTTSTAWAPEDDYHPRVSAISLASQRIFQAINIWDDIKARRISPFNAIQVWEEAGPGKIQFNARDIAETNLGFIIENDVMLAALEENLKKYPQIVNIKSVHLSEFNETTNYIELKTQTNEIYHSKLVVGADGGQSWVRKQADISVNNLDYEQLAIVATLTTSQPHLQTARQVFLGTGPLAFLPLKDPHTTSIVWSLPNEEAKNKLALEDAEFCRQLAVAFDYKLGDVVTIGKRYQFPLRKQEAKHYIHSRVALIGDAAHIVHPLAGQGVNIGLLDAASLFEVINNAIKDNRDFASIHTLRRYERWRKADNASLLSGVHAIKEMFASNKVIIKGGRSLGLTLINKMQSIKNIFTRHAVGKRADLPMLAQ